MSQSIIEVEKVSKLYRLDRRDSASSLREEMDQLWKSFFRKKAKTESNAYVHLSEAQRGPTPETFWALKDVSFSVEQGEVIAIIGKNGSGKSTLLKILSQVTQPTAGRAVLRGRCASLLEIGTGFHPELSGRENVFLNGTILGMKRKEIRKRFDEIVAFAGVEDFIDAPVKHYSSGMHVRLAFSVAAHLDPEILILDEVLSVGDIDFQYKSMNKIKEVAAGGSTVIFVTHNMAAVLGLAQRALLLENGRLSENSSGAEAVEKYERRQTAGSVKTELQPGVFDLEELPRGDGDQKIKLLRLIMKNSIGEITSRFQPREPITLCIQLSSRLRSDFLEVGYAVRSVDGVFLFTSSSCFSGEFFPVREGEFEIQTQMNPNHLKKGVYKIQIGTICGVPRDLIAEAAQFEIAASKDSRDEPLEKLPGYFCFNYQWAAPKPLQKTPA